MEGRCRCMQTRDLSARGDGPPALVFVATPRTDMPKALTPSGLHAGATPHISNSNTRVWRSTAETG